MPNDPKLHFPLAELLRSGNLILIAGEADSAVAGRLPTGFIAGARTLWQDLGGADTAQAMAKGAAGDLTKEEMAKRTALQAATQPLKDTAKKAFSGQDVKLHDEFQVGINEPHDTASLLRRAGIMLASATETANAAALQAKGYGAADRQKLADAIGAFRGTDSTHETAKNDGTAATGARTSGAVDLCDRLETIQNAASLEYPEIDPANKPKRATFLLGTFPPKGGGAKKPATPASTPPVTPPVVPFPKASNPGPANAATNVATTGLQFTWQGGEGNVYLGTVAGTWSAQAIAVYSPINVAGPLGPLLPNTTYYWQVNIIGGPPGDIWSFTTAP